MTVYQSTVICLSEPYSDNYITVELRVFKQDTYFFVSQLTAAQLREQVDKIVGLMSYFNQEYFTTELSKAVNLRVETQREEKGFTITCVAKPDYLRD